MKMKRVKISRTRVDIQYSSKTPCDLELLRFDQKKTLFEQLFHREVTLSK